MALTKKRAGIYLAVPKMEYKAYLPSKLQDIKIDLTSISASKLIEANRLLSRLDAASTLLKNIDLFITSYVRKEALMSSQIEGTQTSLFDVFDPNAETNTNINVLDVVNYTAAINFAVSSLDKLPISNRLLKQTHRILLKHTRGGQQYIGEFRKSQNWIGSRGCGLKNAQYVPPAPSDMLNAMSDLEKYINQDECDIDALIRVALIHYQFETIHPFIDGNGRIGRMLIVLYLIKEGLIKFPVFYISYFLKKNRFEYYYRLGEVRKSGNYEQWVNFFLDATIATCKDAIKTIELIGTLDQKNLTLLNKHGNNTTKQIYYYLLAHPIIQVGKTAKDLKLGYNTVQRAIDKLVQWKILKKENTNKRNRVFSYRDYLDILEKDTENI